MNLIDFGKLMGYVGAMAQLITSVYIIITSLSMTPYIRTFGLDYTLYDLLSFPAIVIGLILLVSGIFSVLILTNQVEIQFDNRIHGLMITGFIGNGFGGFLVVGAGILYSVYEQKSGKTWEEK